MAEFNVSTTGINVTLNDLDITFTHPSTIDLYADGLGNSDILDSLELQDALDAGTLIATDGNGTIITSVGVGSIGAKLDVLNTFMQVTNTDITTNLNGSTGDFTTVAPISGVITTGSNLVNFTKTTNGVQVNFDGIILVLSNIDMFGTTTRANTQSRLRLNGTLFGSVGASGYIRNNSGHNESSVHSMGVIPVTNGQEITVGVKREARAGTTVFNDIGTSNLILIRLK
jgi:hypothetical protein